MPTVIATPGAPDANSYVTVLEADAYHETRLFSTWSSLTTPIKEVAVIQATRQIDVLYEWEGWPTDADQALLWPRVGPTDFNQWRYLQDNEIPQLLKDAVSEFAWQLTREDRLEDSDIETQQITSLSAGSVSLAFGEGVQAKVVPDSVANLIPEWWGYLKGRGGIRESERS